MNAIDTHADELRYPQFCQLLGLPTNPNPAQWAAWIARLNADRKVARHIEESSRWAARIQQGDAGEGENPPWNEFPVTLTPDQQTDFIRAGEMTVSIDLARENGFCADQEVEE